MNLFLIGWFGAGNIGDEAILLAELFAIRAKLDNVRFSILSFNAERTKKLTGEISEVDLIVGMGSKHRFFRSDFTGLFRAFSKADTVIIGGGGIFQDIYNHYPIPFFTAMALISKVFRKPLFFFSLGIGPVKTTIGKILTRAAANMADVVSVRDAESKDLLAEIGFSGKVHLSADPVFMLRSMLCDKTERSLQLQDNRNDGPVVGICVQNLLSWGTENKKALARVLDTIANNRNARLVFLPFGVYSDGWFDSGETEPVDVAASREIAALLKNESTVISGYSAMDEVMAAIGGMDFIVSMRLHGLIAGISMGVPVIALTYRDETKITNLMKRTGSVEDLFFADDLDAGRLMARIEHVLSNLDVRRLETEKNALMLKKEAEKSFELLYDRLSLKAS